MEPRVVTGLGICSAIGIGRDAFFRALENPVLLRDKPSQPVESFDASKYEGAAVVNP